METSLPVVDCCPLCSDLDSFIVGGFPLSIRYRRSLHYSIYWFVARHPFAEGDSLGRPVLWDLHLGLARSAERDPGARLSHNMVSKPIYFYTYYSTFSRFILAIRGRPCVESEKAPELSPNRDPTRKSIKVLNGFANQPLGRSLLHGSDGWRTRMAPQPHK